MTRKEFITQHIAFERGMILAYQGVINNCKACIKAHRAEITKKRVNAIADMNKHLWRDEP